MQYSTVRFASQLAYIGNTGSGSVSGYWTIWATKVRWEAGEGWRQIGQPVPVKLNQTTDDLKKYRGKLYDYYQLHERELVLAALHECECGKEFMAADNVICPVCGR